jgi:hypothetical protein
MHRFHRTIPLAVTAGLLALAAPAAVAAPPQLLKARSFALDAERNAARSCALTDARGGAVIRRTLRAPASGAVSVRTRGGQESDWDVGLVDRATGRVLNGAASSGSRDYFEALVGKGQKLALHACRLDGDGGLRVTVRFAKSGTSAEPDETPVRQVRVELRSAFERFKLESLGLDTTDHAAPSHQDVILHSDADAAKLRQAGLRFTVRQADLLRHDRGNRLVERRAQARVRAARRQGPARIAQVATALPSGRASYRTLPEINDELRALAERYPSFVRLITIGTSRLGKPIQGIEIAENVNAVGDGRPSYVQVGTHHAREWPANELTLEFGYELIRNYARDPGYNQPFSPRLDRIVREARTFVIPVLNVDGFDVTIESEGLNPDGSYEDPVDSGSEPGRETSGSQGSGSGAYKRKTCYDPDPARQALPCILRTSYHATPDPADTPADFPDRGVDPNRNYGVEWGGPGTSSNVQSLIYHGPRPFSEPETEAFRRWLRDRNPTVLITNHTFTGLILRPPGTSDFGPTPDEFRMRVLGDAMAAQVNYISQFSYQLYDTTGTTDDYLYDGLGAFSYTPEIGKQEFHPEYTTGVVPEYDGPPELDANGDPTGRQLGGLREAFTLAGETAIDADSHSVITGVAPPGRILRLSKTISYTTSGRPTNDTPPVQNPQQTIVEPRVLTLPVPASGQFAWHVNPSSQPRSSTTSAWTLTCEDGAGNVLERRNIFVARDQVVNVGLTCGQASGGGTGTPTQPLPPQETGCVEPDGFRRVNVSRRGRGLKFTIIRSGDNDNLVRVSLYQSSIGRRIIEPRLVKRWTGKTRSFRWKGRRARVKLRNGYYYAVFRVRDDDGRLDVRRVVVQRKKGRFSKRGDFYLQDTCR